MLFFFYGNREYEIDFILLAGYLKLIPVELVHAYPKSILNIHPSLLPAFGGKGFYGLKVHKAVIASGARYDSFHLSISLTTVSPLLVRLHISKFSRTPVIFYSLEYVWKALLSW